MSIQVGIVTEVSIVSGSSAIAQDVEHGEPYTLDELIQIAREMRETEDLTRHQLDLLDVFENHVVQTWDEQGWNPDRGATIVLW